VGTILAVTPAGHVIVRARSADVVPEGTPVQDARGTLRGRVVRVFGPVARPYLTIRPRRAPSPAEGLAWIGAALRTE
jgi:rRNA processing protein Gar1